MQGVQAALSMAAGDSNRVTFAASRLRTSLRSVFLITRGLCPCAPPCRGLVAPLLRWVWLCFILRAGVCQVVTCVAVIYTCRDASGDVDTYRQQYSCVHLFLCEIVCFAALYSRT